MSFYKILFIKLLLLTVFVKLLKAQGGCSNINNNNNDNENRPSVSVDKFQTNTNSSLYSVIKFNCSAAFPVEWTFLEFPILHTWNVTYERITEDVFNPDLSSLYVSILMFTNISETQVDGIVPICKDTLDKCNFVVASANKDNSSSQMYQRKYNIDTTSKCSYDLWFNDFTHLFYCNSRNETIKPKLLSTYCSNPTECGLSFERVNACKKGKLSPSGAICSADASNCSILNPKMNSSPVPQIISCSDSDDPNFKKNIGAVPTSSSGAFEIYNRSHAPSQHKNDKNLLSIEFSNSMQTFQEGRTFDLVCDASYFHFAKGIHLTLKHLSDASFQEIDLLSLDENNLRMVGGHLSFQEDVELWPHKVTEEDVPVRRLLLVKGISLGIGDWKFTCCAPVWNSTEWITKSEIIFISTATLPKFATGNSTRVVPFQPNKNITCGSKGSPPPVISWIYDKDKLEDEELFISNGRRESSSWSIITIPKDFEGSTMEFRCHAENGAGFVEKMFILSKDQDESQGFSTSLAIVIIVAGFFVNIFLMYCCWRFLSDEDDDLTPWAFFQDFCKKLCTFKCHRNKHPSIHEEDIEDGEGGYTNPSVLDSASIHNFHMELEKRF